MKYNVCLYQIQKGKLHGSIDVGLSVMSIKKRARRIDLDTEEHIYHLKVRVMCGQYICTECFFNSRSPNCLLSLISHSR